MFHKRLGADFKIIGTRPNPLAGSNFVKDSFGFKKKTIQTPDGAREIDVREGDAGPGETKDIETSVLGGTYARVAMSTMTFYSGGTLTLQGNSAMMCCFQGGPINVIAKQYSLIAPTVFITATENLEITTQNFTVTASELNIKGNAIFENNVSIGGSLNVMGELFVPHLTTLEQTNVTSNCVGSAPRINEDSIFALKSALGIMPSQIVGNINLIGPGLGAGTYECQITLENFLLISNILSTSYMLGIPDIVETDHTHFYKCPQYEGKGSMSKVSEEGIAATSNAKLNGTVLQAVSSEPKRKDYNMVSMISDFVGNQVQNRIKKAGEAILKKIVSIF